MPRIIGINIPDEKQIGIALTYIYGIGCSLSKKILMDAQIDFSVKASKITPKEVDRLKKIIEEKYKVEGELRRKQMMEIKRLKDIGCWRGVRHIKRLPVRGQRTKTNARTIRGKKQTVGAGRKPASTSK